MWYFHKVTGKCLFKVWAANANEDLSLGLSGEAMWSLTMTLIQKAEPPEKDTVVPMPLSPDCSCAWTQGSHGLFKHASKKIRKRRKKKSPVSSSQQESGSSHLQPRVQTYKFIFSKLFRIFVPTPCHHDTVHIVTGEFHE